jgi:acyl transferase domain-containing protein
LPTSQAPNPATFWRLLREGRDLIGEVPAERWPETLPAEMPASRFRAFLDQIDGREAP